MRVIEHLKKNGQEYLLSNGLTFGEYDDLFALNYSQIDTPKLDPLFDECRGLIIYRNPLQVASRAFDRFYNYGEDPHSDLYPFETAVIWEKIDGSLISIWRHREGSWHAATRKMSYGEGETPTGVTFHELVERALGCSVQEKFDFLDEQWLKRPFTIICELVSPESRIVKPYPEAQLFVLSVRYLDGPEMSPEEVDIFAERLGLERPKRFSFTSLEALRQFNDLEAFDEGYVLQAEMEPGEYWRIKVKNPAYLAIAHLRDNGAISFKRVVQLVFMGEEGEYLSYFPEDQPVFDPWIEAYKRFEIDVKSLFRHSNHLESQKDYALAVKDSPAAAVLFAMRKGLSFEEAVVHLSDNKKVSILEGYKNA